MTDFWKHVLSGGPVDPEGKVGMESVEVVARALYDEATLDWPMNKVPTEVADAAEEMLQLTNKALAAMAKLADVSRRRLIERGDVQPEPTAAFGPGHQVCPSCEGRKRVLAGNEEVQCSACGGEGVIPTPGYEGPVEPGSPADVERRSSHRPRD